MTRVAAVCEVLHEGRWYPGELLGQWQRVEGRWRATVRYRVGVGEQFVQGRWADTVRADPAPADHASG